jgi:hypothetical protein
VTFFIGSLFFTAAGFLTYREAVDAGPHQPGAAGRRFFVFQPARIDWWATAVQLAGRYSLVSPPRTCSQPIRYSVRLICGGRV